MFISTNWSTNPPCSRTPPQWLISPENKAGLTNPGYKPGGNRVALDSRLTCVTVIYCIYTTVEAAMINIAMIAGRKPLENNVTMFFVKCC